MYSRELNSVGRYIADYMPGPEFKPRTPHFSTFKMSQSIDYLIEGSIIFSYKIDGSISSRHAYKKIFTRRGQLYY